MFKQHHLKFHKLFQKLDIMEFKIFLKVLEL